MAVVAVVPAHNEAHGIADALASIDGQTRPPDRRIVICDRCTDDTAAVAAACGWEVWHTHGNTARKAGALNQAWRRLAGELDIDDLVLIVDADSHLAATFLEVAEGRLRADQLLGAVGGTFLGRPGGGFVGVCQRNEFTRYARDVRRLKGRVLVLTGTATVFRVLALRAVVRGRREDRLPGDTDLYSTGALTEDNEITLALRHLGYRVISPKECMLTTEVMETWGHLARQRLRWKRGALEDLVGYGVTRITAPYWGRQLLSALGIVVTAVYLASIVWALTVGSMHLHPIWLAVTAIFIAERVITVRRRGPLMMALAAVLVVEMVYDVVLQFVQGRAFAQALLNTQRRW